MGEYSDIFVYVSCIIWLGLILNSLRKIGIKHENRISTIELDLSCLKSEVRMNYSDSCSENKERNYHLQKIIDRLDRVEDILADEVGDD